MKAIFHPEAHQEMIESARFYEEKSEGLRHRLSHSSRKYNPPDRGKS
jgi:hypothetical protein